MNETIAPDDLVRNHACPIWMRISAWNLACPFQAETHYDKNLKKALESTKGNIEIWHESTKYIYFFPTLISLYKKMNGKTGIRCVSASFKKRVKKAKDTNSPFTYKGKVFLLEKPNSTKKVREYKGLD